MGRESFAFSETCMMEIIEVLRSGLDTLSRIDGVVADDTRKLIEKWCEDSEEYANEMDRRK